MALRYTHEGAGHRGRRACKAVIAWCLFMDPKPLGISCGPMQAHGSPDMHLQGWVDLETGAIQLQFDSEWGGLGPWGNATSSDKLKVGDPAQRLGFSQVDGQGLGR